MFCVQELLLWELHPGFGHSDIAGDLSMEIFQWVLTQWGSLPLLDVHEEGGAGLTVWYSALFQLSLTGRNI